MRWVLRVKTNQHIPILIPPFGYEDIKGVIPTTHGMKINEKEKLNSLKEVVESFLNLDSLTMNVWERKRDKLLKEIKSLLDNNTTNEIPSVIQREDSEIVFSDLIDPKEILPLIKKRSKEEWADDFEMQLDYIQKQQKAVGLLNNHKPLDIEKEDFQLIRSKAKEEWTDDFEMQLDYEQKQVESLRSLNKL